MLARLELNNSLAPIQEYGRHQKRAQKIKKKELNVKKKAMEGDGEQENTTADAASGEKPATAKDFQDDKFYDLDDDWIDDGDIDDQEDLGDEIHLGETS